MMTSKDALERLAFANSCPDVALTETIEVIQRDAFRSGLLHAASLMKRCEANESDGVDAMKQAIKTEADKSK